MREEAATLAAPHRVAVLVLDDVLPLDLGIPAQVFIAVPGGPYRLTVMMSVVTPLVGLTLRLTDV
ncbi:hypothetical protein ACFPWV_04760, partial [Streptomyces atrovirens]